jgi:predicted membrane GTPase involved in stress response
MKQMTNQRSANKDTTVVLKRPVQKWTKEVWLIPLLELI